MKKNILLLLMPLLFLIAIDAQAEAWCDEETCCVDETNFYAKVLGGANFLQNTTSGRNTASYQTGYVVAGFLGYCWHDGLMGEVEYAFRRNAIRKIHFFGEGVSNHGYFQTSSYMGNLLWSLPLSSWGYTFWNLQPFVGIGIGYDFQQMHSSNSLIVFRQNWHHLSWQVMAGLARSIFCNAEMTLEYKFHQGGCHFYNHSVGVGLVYKFGLLK